MQKKPRTKHYGLVRPHDEVPSDCVLTPAEALRAEVEAECSLIRTDREFRRIEEES